MSSSTYADKGLADILIHGTQFTQKDPYLYKSHKLKCVHGKLDPNGPYNKCDCEPGWIDNICDGK